MMAMLKLPNLTWHIQVGSVNIGGAVQQAVNALLAGVCKYAVVWRAMHNPKGTYQNLPGSSPPGATQFTGPYGFGGPGQGMAVAYTRYLEKNNQTRDKMVTLAMTQRKHGLKNPHSYFKEPLTREDYFDSRMVAYPFCLYDCDIPVQGAVAIVLTTAERARDLKPTPAYLAGYGERLHFEVAGRIGSLAVLHGRRRELRQAHLGALGLQPEGRRRRADLRRLLRFGACTASNPTASARRARRSTSSRAAASSSTASCRSTPSAGASSTGRIHGLWHIIEGVLQASGPRGRAPGEGRERLVRRRERADRDGHHVHLRQGTVLTVIARARSATWRSRGSPGLLRHGVPRNDNMTGSK